MNKAQLTEEVRSLRQAIEEIALSMRLDKEKTHTAPAANRTPTKASLVTEYIHTMPLEKEVGHFEIERMTGVSGMALLQALMGLREKGYIGLMVEKTSPIEPDFLEKKRSQHYIKASKRWRKG